MNRFLPLLVGVVFLGACERQHPEVLASLPGHHIEGGHGAGESGHGTVPEPSARPGAKNEEGKPLEYFPGRK